MRLDKLEGVVKLVRLDKLEGGVDNATYWTGLQELDETERSGKDGTGSTGEAGGQVQGCDLRYLTVGMEASKATRCPGWGSK